MLKVHVKADGSPGEVRIEKSSGYPRLDEAALRVVQQRWRFVPAKRGGVAVAAWYTQPIQFRLDR